VTMTRPWKRRRGPAKSDFFSSCLRTAGIHISPNRRASQDLPLILHATLIDDLCGVRRTWFWYLYHVQRNGLLNFHIPNAKTPMCYRKSTLIYGVHHRFFLPIEKYFNAVRGRHHQNVQNRFLKAPDQNVRFRFRSSGGDALNAASAVSSFMGRKKTCSHWSTSTRYCTFLVQHTHCSSWYARTYDI
jgi:hypothetical protein